MTTALALLQDSYVNPQWRFFHCSDSKLNVGDTLLPANQLTPKHLLARRRQYTNHHYELPWYADNHVYIWDERMLKHSLDPDGTQVYLEMDYTYEVAVIGEVHPDPEREGTLNRYRQEHGHEYPGDCYVDGCAVCEGYQHGGVMGGPDWYHPFLWITPTARIVKVLEHTDVRALCI